MMTFSEAFGRIAFIVALLIGINHVQTQSPQSQSIQVISKKKSLLKACKRLYKRKDKNYATVCEKRGINF
jgi:ABC-type transporter MlaC component